MEGGKGGVLRYVNRDGGEEVSRAVEREGWRGGGVVVEDGNDVELRHIDGDEEVWGAGEV